MSREPGPSLRLGFQAQAECRHVLHASAIEASDRSPFDRRKPALLSVLGIAYRLTLDSLAETARSVARDPPAGIRMLIDYLFD